MPELPEVETLARDLADAVVGEQISAVEVRWPRIVAEPTVGKLQRALAGQSVRAVARRGKYLILALSRGHLVVHLRMTGQLLLDADGRRCEDDPHVHLVLRLASGGTLCYRDVRKFGRFHLTDDPEEIVGSLGPEPLDPELTARGFASRLQAHRRRLKDLLLDQTFLAGLGNIYVDESLWRAGISPRRTSSTLSDDEAATLLRAIRAVLEWAIRARGTTMRDFRDLRGRPGDNRRQLAVYGREGEPCPRCGTAVERDVVAGRGTHYCPLCQPAPEPGCDSRRPSCGASW